MSSATINDWEAAASKEIKGKNPNEALAWHTQEVHNFDKTCPALSDLLLAASDFCLTLDAGHSCETALHGRGFGRQEDRSVSGDFPLHKRAICHHVYTKAMDDPPVCWCVQQLLAVIVSGVSYP